MKMTVAEFRKAVDEYLAMLEKDPAWDPLITNISIERNVIPLPSTHDVERSMLGQTAIFQATIVFGITPPMKP